MSVESVLVSKEARDQLITLKRRTGIAHWNVLCRWAFCVSLAEPSRPRKRTITTDSSVEMTWRTFGGEYEGLYRALLCERCHLDGLRLDTTTLSEQFRLHLHRGIAYLAGSRSLKDIASLILKAGRRE